MSQTNLFDSREGKARARSSDPATSKAAAASVSKIRASQARVLRMFELYGDMHDKKMLELLADFENHNNLQAQSPSGARSRRSELSKPNMDRLAELKAEREKAMPALPANAIDYLPMLRAEGFRSPLVDTGKRETVDGRKVIVWGIAK